MKCYYKITKIGFCPWKYKLSCTTMSLSHYFLIYEGSLKNCQRMLNEIKDGKRDKDGILTFGTAEIEFKD